jgi:phosphoribosylglycinamide formyltransferase-1
MGVPIPTQGRCRVAAKDRATGAVLAVGGGSVSDLAVLISGRGSNLQALMDAIADGRLRGRIALVVSNRPEAAGLDRARAAGIETIVLAHRAHASRDAYDRALVDVLSAIPIDLICLAGFMRLLGPAFCEAFPLRVLNVHPSLLPAFPGVDAQRQALEHGVKVTGATVHFVTPELDAGPIVLQRAVPVLDDDTVEALASRILAVEHAIYPEACELILSGAWRLDGRRVVPSTRGAPAPPPTLVK